MLPKAIANYKHSQAIIVQKYLRGYLVAQKQYCALRNEKIVVNMSFFDKMRHEVQEHAVKVIIRCYRRYMKEKLIRIMQEDHNQKMNKGKRKKKMEVAKKTAPQKSAPPAAGKKAPIDNLVKSKTMVAKRPIVGRRESDSSTASKQSNKKMMNQKGSFTNKEIEVDDNLVKLNTTKDVVNPVNEYLE